MFKSELRAAIRKVLEDRGEDASFEEDLIDRIILETGDVDDDEETAEGEDEDS